MLDNKDDDIEMLELDGYHIVDIVAGDVNPTKEVKYIIDKIIGEKHATFFSDLLYSLTSEKFPEDQSKDLWQGILFHKYIVSEKLGRNVGVRVAALDYLENIKKIIQAPKIIDETEFRKTLSLASTDPLTGLFNRRKFNEQLLAHIKHSKTTGDIFSLLMLDLDGFKEYNDTQGHHAGDFVLQEFSKILKDELRSDSVVGRYGGDEMVVIIDGANRNTARAISERIRARVETELRETNVTVSIGVAEFPSDGDSFDRINSAVDEILYRAKEFGGNRVAYFVPVTFSYVLPAGMKAKEVACVGDFNRWSKKYGMMHFNEQKQEWFAVVNLKPGRYRYKFLVDGSKWLPDTAATEFSDDGFSGQCSVVVVKMD